MQFLQSRERHASLVDPARLRQAHDVNSMTIGQFEALLNGLTAKAGGFRVAARDVMSETEGRIEQRILRIVRAHADGLLDVVDGLIRSTVEGKRTAQKAVRGGKVRIEI